MVSPLTRAIETAAILFGDHPHRPRVLIEVLHRECQESSCDVGRAASEIAAEFPHLDVGHLPEIWWHAEAGSEVGGYPVEPRPCSTRRVAAFREWLRARPETTIAVVGHGTFFYHLTGTFLENCGLIELDLDAAPVRGLIRPVTLGRSLAGPGARRVQALTGPGQGDLRGLATEGEGRLQDRAGLLPGAGNEGGGPLGHLCGAAGILCGQPGGRRRAGDGGG